MKPVQVILSLCLNLINLAARGAMVIARCSLRVFRELGGRNRDE